MTQRVTTPIFDLSGPSCEDTGCSGVQVLHFKLKEKVYYQECSKCGKKMGEITSQRALDQLNTSLAKFLGISTTTVLFMDGATLPQEEWGREGESEYSHHLVVRVDRKKALQLIENLAHQLGDVNRSACNIYFAGQLEVSDE